MTDAIYDALIDRADWLKSEYLAGGDLTILRAKEEECRYIAKKFIKSSSPEVTALVEAAQKFRHAFVIATGGKSPFCVQALSILDTALAPFTEKEPKP